jgi:hypothetical protein
VEEPKEIWQQTTDHLKYIGGTLVEVVDIVHKGMGDGCFSAFWYAFHAYLCSNLGEYSNMYVCT